MMTEAPVEIRFLGGQMGGVVLLANVFQAFGPYIDGYNLLELIAAGKEPHGHLPRGTHTQHHYSCHFNPSFQI